MVHLASGGAVPPFVQEPYGTQYLRDMGMVPVTRVRSMPVLSEEQIVAGLMRFAMGTYEDFGHSVEKLRYEIDWVVLSHGMTALEDAVNDLDVMRENPCLVVFEQWLLRALPVLVAVEAGTLPADTALPPVPVGWRGFAPSVHVSEGLEPGVTA
ncbi:hypothetical protein Ga0074812_1726 [Parafrankia irregularis]|uniref:Uncharacterized protein n=1 Tax=Parafrankia irregularis TaxID=795642 RepID=A0A0S4R236_9ACTN|nr:hypothetical protein [Parafrankia irregularis]CUU61276.1 hypothetical protein Ga0074812_1726 [Parafrankia irregularis]